MWKVFCLAITTSHVLLNSNPKPFACCSGFGFGWAILLEVVAVPFFDGFGRDEALPVYLAWHSSPSGHSVGDSRLCRMLIPTLPPILGNSLVLAGHCLRLGRNFSICLIGSWWGDFRLSQTLVGLLFLSY